MKPVHLLRFELFADYFQFYLWDPEADPRPPTDWSNEEVANRIHTAPHVAVISPVRNMTVPVTLEVYDTDPGFEASNWDHVAECSLLLDSGMLEVHECTGGSIARLLLSPGSYRIRAMYGDLDSLSPNGLEGDDHYLVTMWPAPNAPVSVRKQWHEVEDV